MKAIWPRGFLSKGSIICVNNRGARTFTASCSSRLSMEPSSNFEWLIEPAQMHQNIDAPVPFCYFNCQLLNRFRIGEVADNCFDMMFELGA